MPEPITMLDEEEEEEKEKKENKEELSSDLSMLAIPLPHEARIENNVVLVPSCLAVTMAINLLIQKDMQEHMAQ